MAVHARTYSLLVPHVNMINAPTKGTGFSGSFTKTNGLLAYYEVNNMKFLINLAF